MTIRSQLQRLAACALAVLVSVGCAQLPERSQAKLLPQPPVDYDPATDDSVLTRVRADVDAAWQGYPLPPLANEDDDLVAGVAPLTSISVELLGRYPSVIEVKCQNSVECKIPVLIRTRKLSGSGKRVCFAVLPFLRYAVLKPGAGKREPKRISFYLARWDVQQQKPVPLTTSLLFAFNKNLQAPLVGVESGVFLHELHIDPQSNKSVRKALGADYFSRGGGAFDPLHSVWNVGGVNTWTPTKPYIGAVLGGVMALPLVLDMDRVTAKDPNPFCKPIDPIIVNVKN